MKRVILALFVVALVAAIAPHARATGFSFSIGNSRQGFRGPSQFRAPVRFESRSEKLFRLAREADRQRQFRLADELRDEAREQLRREQRLRFGVPHRN